MHRSEHRSEADTAHAAEDDVESHVDLGVLTAELLRSHVDAAAGRDDDADGLVDDVDALEDVDGGLIVVLIGGGDSEHVDRVHETVHNAVPAFHSDNELAARGGERIVAERGDGVGVSIGGGRS